ncbi:hypothetical protein HNQ99_000911 [Rhizorhapis suberifaciens]|uniref:Winged helix-turn helix domain-containing protein n=1 Tax=Rhizorhapis suberifaciens TaxID=13656 RepID=A0A840HSS7_9SPHN|nr:hypothetical protein [Rhizorhapis suberifaciens]
MPCSGATLWCERGDCGSPGATQGENGLTGTYPTGPASGQRIALIPYRGVGDWVDADGEITIPELAARLLAKRGVKVHPASLSRLLIHQGFTVRKTLLASETDRADIARAWRVSRAHRQPWMKKTPGTARLSR